MTARNHRALTEIWRSVVRVRLGFRWNGSRCPVGSQWLSASDAERTKPRSAETPTWNRTGNVIGRGTPVTAPDIGRSTTNGKRIGWTPRAGRGLRLILNVAGRFLGSLLGDVGPLTPNERGQHGPKKTPGGRHYESPSLGSGSTPRRKNVGRPSTPVAVESLEANGSVPVTPNDRRNFGQSTGTPTGRLHGRSLASGDSTTPRLHDGRANGTRPDVPPASATPTFAPSPSVIYSGYSTVSVDGAPIAISPSQRHSITWFRSCVVGVTPSVTSFGPVAHATRPRADGSSWSSATGVATVAAPLPDREGAVSLRCRAASSRTTQGEGR